MANNGNGTLADIEAKIKKLNERKAALLQAEKKQERKDDTREKVLLGAGMLADIEAGKTNREGVNEILKRSITAPKDREFLKGRNWNL